MKVAEIYLSQQGEGLLAGTPSAFVRASGCNLRCRWCDTPYASWLPEGDDLSVAEIVDRVSSFDCSHVVLTGGEPMLFTELGPLSEELSRQGKHVTIETAGTLFLPVACDLMSISPKLSNSAPSVADDPRWHRRHERARQAPDAVRKLMSAHEHQLKFVVDSPVDADEALDYLAQFEKLDRRRVLLMPQGVDAAKLREHAAWLEPYCRDHGVRFCPRLHIEWYGLQRGT